MATRVFISYRTSDGADKATALARDLDALFGNSQVFLDKDDLPAGSRWRDAITQVIEGCPILIVLVTPNYLGARNAEGERCIARPDDPARAELEAAVAAKAHIIPLLCDGVGGMPSTEDLPKPFDMLAELQWGRLRAFDWREDLARLAENLRQLGVTAAEEPAQAPPSQPATMPVPLGSASPRSSEPITTPMLYAGEPGAPVAAPDSRRRVLGLGALLVVTAAGWQYWRWHQRQAANLSGTWRARISPRPAPVARPSAIVLFKIEQKGQLLTLASNAVDIEHDPDWENYRDFWRQQKGTELKRVYYRGEGKVFTEDEEDDEEVAAAASAAAHGKGPSTPVAVRRVSIAMRIFPPGGDSEAIDGGALKGTVDLDDQRIYGQLWLNSEQANRIVELRRGG